MPETEFDVLGLGSVTVDFVGTIEKWPAEGGKQPLESLSIHDGGLVGTALVAVSRLGGHAAFAGKLGISDMAKRAIESLKNEKIDVSLVVETANAEPIVAFVLTNTHNGQRNLFWTRQQVSYPFPNELPDKEWHKKTRVFLFDYESGQSGIEAAKIAHASGIPVVSDIECIGPYTAEGLALTQYIILSEDFAIQYTGQQTHTNMLKTLRTNNSQTAIITLGHQGCIGSGPEGDFKLPAFKVNAIDTTGCGDTFHGAFALGIAHDMKVVEAARFASAAAALCATKIGGRGGIPSLTEVNNLLSSEKQE